MHPARTFLDFQGICRYLMSLKVVHDLQFVLEIAQKDVGFT